jgi:carboxyl-terminal processing protease
MGIGILIGRGPLAPTTALMHSYSASGTVIGVGQSPPPDVAQDVDFKLFWQEWQMLKDKYYKQPINDKDMFYGAMSGLAASLGDPYTQYFAPKDADNFETALKGQFSGIGAEIGVKDGNITVIAPLPDTPAQKAGILAGDIITAIDGTSTDGMGVDQAVSLIRGDEGTQVKLTLFRANDKKHKDPFDLTLTRAVIHVSAVNLTWKGKIALIQVTSFNDDTRTHFEQTVQDVLKQDPKGIILDLRNDPGGYLDVAVQMAGEWVGDQVVVKERRQGKIVEQLNGTGKDRFAHIPTIVLVNQGSASASEIVSGTLQDYKAATIVGTKTFGKGSVQDFSDLPDGSAIKITIAEWLTPNDRTINKTGLDPDVVVDRTPDDYEAQRDPQLDRALGILNGTATGTPATATSTR